MFDKRIPIWGFHGLTKEYIEDNIDDVAMNNRKSMLRVLTIYTVAVFIYFILSLTVFSEWGVSEIYCRALIIQIPVLLIMNFRFRKKHRTYRETTAAAYLTHFYIMCFVIVISVQPRDMSPAVYFAPILIGFSAVFIFPWYQTVLLLVLECVGMVGASSTESSEMFNINLFSTILALVMSIYVIRVLHSHRISENNTRKKLEEIGMIDKLTGLYNKGSMEAKCREYLDKHENCSCALLVIDFDNFKTVNDSFGHQQGDQVLAEFGRILRKTSDTGDIVGRIGGDEFMMMITHPRSMEEVKGVANRINSLTRGILSDELIFSFSCSIGVCFRPEGENYSYERLFSYADRALYQVKERGKDQNAFFSREMLELDAYSTVMIVDSMRVSRAILISCLEDDYHILETDHSKEALSMIQGYHGEIAAFIIDIEQRPSHFEELLQEIASDERISSAPVFLVKTQMQQEISDTHGLKVSYINKPFDPVRVHNLVADSIDGILVTEE